MTPGEPVALGEGVGPPGVGVGEPDGPSGVVGVGEGDGTISEVTLIIFGLLVAVGVTRPLIQRPISTLAG